MKYYNLTTEMTFGKHQGITIDEIITKDKNYISWCIINLDHFMISKDSLDEMKSKYSNFNLSKEAEEELKNKNELILAEAERDSNEEDYSDYEESRTFGNYSGSYAQDVEGYSDQDIDDIFDGDPDAYWNID
jgi:hypothetical protein